MTKTQNILQSQITTSELLNLTTEIVAAYVSNSDLAAGDLPNFIQQVYISVTDLATGKAGAAPRPEPAVSIKKSIAEDYIICLEDGKKLKMLKRHLRTAYNMTPEQYRERWGLASNYPMVAPNYARHRSEIAKTIGLGIKRRRVGHSIDKAA